MVVMVKKWTGLILIGVLVFSGKFAYGFSSVPCTGNIVTHLTDYVPTHGALFVSLTNEKAQFISAEVSPSRQIEITPTVNEATAVFENIPFGEYAVKVYQDRNGNKKLDTFLGFPQEPTGYSNYNDGILPPPFKKAKFKHESAVTSLNVLVRNFKK